MEADEVRTDTSWPLKNYCAHIKSNITKEEHHAIKQLREDQTKVVLTVDKAVAMVVVEKQDYMDKALALLNGTSTHKTLHKDPTTRLRNSLITKVKGIKQQGGLSDNNYKKLYPTSAVPSMFYGLSQINETGTTLSPIISIRGSIIYGVTKELAGIICPLVGQSLHYL